jgi:hypothetical protein
MAAVSKSRRRANPALTKNGKPRLKLLNLAQANSLLEKTQRARDKGKIRNRILVLEKRAR